MPLYEYRCPNGHDFEKFFRSIGTASSQAECPACGVIGERRLSTTGLVFKGSGFYITDYGKDGKKAGREAATAAKTKTDAAAATASSPTSSDTRGSSESSKSDAAPAEKPKASEAAPPKQEPSPKSEPAKSSPAKSTKSE